MTDKKLTQKEWCKDCSIYKKELPCTKTGCCKCDHNCCPRFFRNHHKPCFEGDHHPINI